MINPVDMNTTLQSFQFKKLENLDSKNIEKLEDKKMMETAQDFEAVFIHRLLEIMDSTVEKSDFMRGGQAEETFKSMLNEEISKNIASSPSTSFGLAKQIYEQMKELK